MHAPVPKSVLQNCLKAAIKHATETQLAEGGAKFTMLKFVFLSYEKYIGTLFQSLHLVSLYDLITISKDTMVGPHVEDESYKNMAW